jgi:hypothetical protein
VGGFPGVMLPGREKIPQSILPDYKKNNIIAPLCRVFSWRGVELIKHVGNVHLSAFNVFKRHVPD